MPKLRRSATIFAVSDIGAAVAHYQRLGFETRVYERGGYAFATRDQVEIHLGGRSTLDPAANTCGIYLFVDDADALATEWRAAGVDVATPEDTEWRQHKGTHRDPWGNVIRFGSPPSGSQSE